MQEELEEQPLQIMGFLSALALLILLSSQQEAQIKFYNLGVLLQTQLIRQQPIQQQLQAQA
jgi:hypothetical protein